MSKRNAAISLAYVSTILGTAVVIASGGVV